MEVVAICRKTIFLELSLSSIFINRISFLKLGGMFMEVKKINDVTYEIPKEKGMNVPGRLFVSEKLLEAIKGDKSLEQVKNVACMPGILKYSFAMPDMHMGYGFSIGGGAAFDAEEGIITPGGIGFDINCGVRLLNTNLKKEDVEPKIKELLDELFRRVPCGTGR